MRLSRSFALPAIRPRSDLPCPPNGSRTRPPGLAGPTTNRLARANSTPSAGSMAKSSAKSPRANSSASFVNSKSAETAAARDTLASAHARPDPRRFYRPSDQPRLDARQRADLRPARRKETGNRVCSFSFQRLGQIPGLAARTAKCPKSRPDAWANASSTPSTKAAISSSKAAPLMSMAAAPSDDRGMPAGPENPGAQSRPGPEGN